MKMLRCAVLRCAVTQGASPELALQGDLPANYTRDTGAGDCEAAVAALGAASKLMEALGGQVLGR